jgi:hypothetical protein
MQTKTQIYVRVIAINDITSNKLKMQANALPPSRRDEAKALRAQARIFNELPTRWLVFVYVLDTHAGRRS